MNETITTRHPRGAVRYFAEPANSIDFMRAIKWTIGIPAGPAERSPAPSVAVTRCPKSKIGPVCTPATSRAAHINSTENFFSLLKRAILGTYVAVRPWHLSRYCHEQGWRFNWRQLNDAGRFLNALRGVIGKRLTYRELAAVGDAGFMGIK